MTLLVDAVSYLFSVVTLAAIKAPDTPPPGADGHPGLRRQVTEGFAAVLRHPLLRTICLEAFTYNFFVQFGETLIVLYALTVLDLSAGMLGLAIGIGSLGGLAGAIVAPRAVRRFGFGRTFIAGTALGCAAPVLVPLASGPPFAAGATIAASYLVTGFGVTISVIGSVTLRQTVAPAHLLGRVNAVMRLASYAAVPLGAAATGLTAAAVGVRTGLFLGAAGLALPTLILLFSPVRRMSTTD
ncbi:MFS transporter [Actinoplanes xinjiangensis]|uniref:MFS transporter n=1 Tax=Actinoplanes xinjiangensis TaxID=512350 RepID=A0A316EIP7_9ACTN|nr:MFS transporter [Actinoplanes xinjiangensis]PWK28698.1 MFS transporter [Actinoplanes xinjiangensis]GIF45110.1 hypothetical protein Axi01nite_94210 [Actinoplanes xinjiangensis]